MRPSEAVMAYLKREAEQRPLTEGSRLPPIREVAAELNVSIRTVQSVFQKLSRLGRLRTVVGNGTFWVARRSAHRDILDIALRMHATTGAADEEWVHGISSGILSAASQGTPRVRLLPLPHRMDDPAAARQLLKERHLADGLILFPSPFNNEVRQAYEASGRPVIDLNPPSETAVTNFVSPDYYGASRLIGTAWRETGRKRVLLMLHTSLERSVSNRVRFSGLANGLGIGLSRSVFLLLAVSESAHQEHAYQTMKECLAAPEGCPDAVYCVSDHQAPGVLRAIAESGLQVPGDISVVGGSGFNFPTSAYASLTRTKQPFHKLGVNLLELLRERIRENRSVPAVILETPFIGGATTRPQENVILGIQQ